MVALSTELQSNWRLRRILLMFRTPDSAMSRDVFPSLSITMALLWMKNLPARASGIHGLSIFAAKITKTIWIRCGEKATRSLLV